jgi:hypothetical protein
VTALQLLFYSSAALLLQITAGLGLAAWRWQRIRTSPARLPIKLGANVQALAWRGLRDFRMLRRQFEDALRTQCSFHLAPVDRAPVPPFRAGLFLTFALDIPQPGGGTSRPITHRHSISETLRPDG